MMSKRVLPGLLIGLMIGCALPGRSADDQPAGYGIGNPVSESETRRWNIDVPPSGEGLPPGRGTVNQGAIVFSAKCAKCHGATGVEGPMDRLVGGRESLSTEKPVKTIGSFWPYATTLYDYINRAMPFDAPQSLTPDEVYSVIAWLLYQNGIISEESIVDANTLPLVQMPNRHGFVPDPRPDVRSP